jgi:NAD(P)-dependent dehydrogenase (short-subunit alcohol dehydrogenase family)
MVMNIHTVAVIGSGTMGAGIAEVAASHGHQVLIYDIAAAAISRAIDGIRQRLASRVTRGKLSADASGQILARLIPVTDINALAAADLVIEAASERLEVKKALFAQLAEICQPQTLLTSNTSSISVTAIAADIRHPERVAGLHFFNPAPVMKLVEVVRGWRHPRKWRTNCARWQQTGANSLCAVSPRRALLLTVWRVLSILKPGVRWKNRWQLPKSSMPRYAKAVGSRWDRWS